MEGFGKRLKIRAGELNLTDAAVARRAGLSVNRYANYVADYREPNLITLVRIAGVLDVSTDELLGIDKKQRKSEKSLLMERLTLAAKHLKRAELETFVKSIEAVADDQ